MGKIVFMFPGQGAQKIGMSQEFYAARRLSTRRMKFWILM